jgi:energy-coupling factor transport system substrate-specific component
MSQNVKNQKSGALISIVGFLLTALAIFLPLYQNPNIVGNLFNLISASGIVLPVVIIIGIVLGLASSLLSLKADGKQKATLFATLRVAGALMAVYGLFGIVQKLKVGPDPDTKLAVTALFGTWLFIVGIVLALVGAIKDYFSIRKTRWSTIDLVLIVMTAALYGAALLTLSFIKLTPGTWLRPANALQAPFGILFGLPGAIGIGLGNVLADLSQGAAPHVMVLGLLVNFCAAFLPYLFVSNARLATRKSVIEFFIWAVVIGGMLPALSIWINVWMGLTPKFVAMAFSPVVFLNQLVAASLLGIPLTKLLYPFVVRSGLYRGRKDALDK